MANVVLVEDNFAVRKSLADYLFVSGHHVSEAENAVELYGLMDRQQYDVAVVDINLPHHSGFSITRYLSEKALCTVIITTVRDSVEDRVLGYQSGADIYMVKPVEPAELSAAITRLATKWQATGTPCSPEFARRWTLDLKARRLWAPNGKAVTLTQREARLIAAIAAARGSLLERKELLVRIEESDNEERRGRLDTMLSRLRAKVLGSTTMALPLVTVHNAGIGFSGAVDVSH